MKISQLNVSKSDKHIIKNLSIDFAPGKIHVIMGPNGSGKTTLAYTIAGHPDCNVSSGSILFNNKNILDLEVNERSIEGVFLAPQYPSVIEGLSHAALLKEAINIRKEKLGEDPLDEFDFLQLLREKANEFKFSPKEYIRNSLNFGFSGGEKKRNEILQISLLQPTFIILDEIDSGLDIEAMKYIAQFINAYVNPNITILAITHYPNFAKLLNTSEVHILRNGSIIKSGDTKLIDSVETNGFGDF